MSKLNKTGAAGAICSVAVIIGPVLSNGEVKPAVPAWNLSATPRDAAVTRTNARLMYGRMVSATRTALNPVRENRSANRRGLEKNIPAAERCVINYAAGDKLQQGAFDAAVSITFNAGCATMQKSTMFRLFRQGKLWPPASSSHAGYMPAA